MTEVEKLIQEVNDKPPSLGGVILLLDKCHADLGRLMETAQIGRCIHARNLVYGLRHAREMLAQVQHKINETLNPKTDKKCQLRQNQNHNKAETPFGAPVWPWNQPPLCGNPSKQRCQSVVSADEATTGTELVAALSPTRDACSRPTTSTPGRPYSRSLTPSVELTLNCLRREMAACNHEVFLAAQAELAELREEALKLVSPS